MADSVLKSLLGAVDGALTQGGNLLVRSDLVTDLIATTTRMEAIVRRRAERNANWVLHQYYLPSSSDVRRVSAQIAALEARIRDMTERLDELDDAPVRGTAGSASRGD